MRCYPEPAVSRQVAHQWHHFLGAVSGASGSWLLLQHDHDSVWMAKESGVASLWSHLSGASATPPCCCGFVPQAPLCCLQRKGPPHAVTTCRSSYIPMMPPASPSPFKAHRTARGTSALGLRAAPRRAAISRNARISLADLNADKKGSQPGHLQYPRSMPSVKVKSVKSE